VTVLARFGHHPRIASTLPRDAPPGMSGPPTHRTSGQACDDAQWTERAGDHQRLATIGMICAARVGSGHVGGGMGAVQVERW
jgi:hypothetical protein